MMFFYSKGRLLLILLSYTLLWSCTSDPIIKDVTSFDTNQIDTTTKNISALGMSGVVVSSSDNTPLGNITIYIPSLYESDKKFIANRGLGSSDSNSSNCAKPTVSYISYTCSKLDGSFFLPLSISNS